MRDFHFKPWKTVDYTNNQLHLIIPEIQMYGSLKRVRNGIRQSLGLFLEATRFHQ